MRNPPASVVHRRGLTVAILVVSILAPQQPADAAVKKAGIFRYVSTSQTFPRLAGEGQRAADCPGDTTVTGGGGSLPRTVDGDLRFVGFSDGDDQDGAPDDAALAYARWEGATSRVTVKGLAVCTTLDSVVVVPSTTAVPAQQTLGLTVACAGGTQPIGGGGGSLDQDVILFDSYAAGGGLWQVTVHNSGDSTASASVAVACLPNGERTIELPETVVVVQNSTEPRIKAPCPAGTRVSGGGWTSGTPITASSSLPYDGRDADTAPDDGWAVRIPNDTGSPVQVFVSALCIGGAL